MIKWKYIYLKSFQSLFCVIWFYKPVDEKIRLHNVDLQKYNEQLKKAKPAQQVAIKKRAMDVLKRKKMYESQRDQLTAQQFNVDQTAFTIETIKDTQTTVQAMKAATVTLSAANKQINISEIEDMQDEMEGIF